MLGFSGILMYYIERYARPEAFENIGDGFWWAMVASPPSFVGDIYPITPVRTVVERCRHLIAIAMIAVASQSLGLHDMLIKKAKEKKQFINVIYGTRNPT